TSRLHGLSGLDIAADGRSFTAISDEGDLVQGRIDLDADGRLSGLSNVKLSPLRGEDGQPFQSKDEADAEDVTLLPGGGFAVSFERDHRILAYAKANGPGQLVFRANGSEPGFKLAENSGMEALTAEGDALIAGTESGDIRAIVKGALTAPAWAPSPPGGYNLTGLDALEGGDWIGLYRAYDPIRGARAVIAWLPQARCIRAPCEAPHGLIELARLDRPLTVDNFEAIAAVPLAGDRGWRIYILSDDNFSEGQRTLLLAFDWVWR
ncbi:MAG: esterase-like activity of phytase family protein, partial [Caulobacteraceae bacterium]